MDYDKKVAELTSFCLNGAEVDIKVLNDMMDSFIVQLSRKEDEHPHPQAQVQLGDAARVDIVEREPEPVAAVVEAHVEPVEPQQEPQPNGQPDVS